ncbi:MAG: PLP-dependent aminotransferase family protein [Eubacteriales bacterium]|nr:PLP-dependent aminotransferase family protein [Eubacteriales bacterium]
MVLAERMKRVKGSEIRSVGKKIASRNSADLIKLSAGIPDEALFPAEALQAATLPLFEEPLLPSLQYGLTKGDTRLIHLIAERMRQAERMEIPEKNILITTGCQQGISLSSVALLDKGDAVLVEKPTYMDGLNASIPYECRFIGIETDDSGMVAASLEDALRTVPRVKMIYVIPNFQNPTGKAWPMKRRQEFMEVVRKFPDVMVVEDNPYGELRFRGEFIPSLKSLDTLGQVIYLGSFSKILSPGLRVAWVVAHDDLIEKLEILKEGFDLQSNQFAQSQVVNYLMQNDLTAHVEELRMAYREKCDTMLREIKRTFPPEAKVIEPDGGMFIWISLPDYINTSDMLEEALDAGVSYIPGISFFADGRGTNGMRLNFTSNSCERITIGVDRLAKVIQNNIR